MWCRYTFGTKEAIHQGPWMSISPGELQNATKGTELALETGAFLKIVLDASGNHTRWVRGSEVTFWEFELTEEAPEAPMTKQLGELFELLPKPDAIEEQL